MSDTNTRKQNHKNDSPSRPHKLDITGEICPMTFVKTKLALEAIAPGDSLEVRLSAGEPVDNVPRSVAEAGHTILSLEPESPAGDVYRLSIRRRAD